MGNHSLSSCLKSIRTRLSLCLHQNYTVVAQESAGGPVLSHLRMRKIAQLWSDISDATCAAGNHIYQPLRRQHLPHWPPDPARADIHNAHHGLGAAPGGLCGTVPHRSKPVPCSQSISAEVKPCKAWRNEQTQCRLVGHQGRFLYNNKGCQQSPAIPTLPCAHTVVP